MAKGCSPLKLLLIVPLVYFLSSAAVFAQYRIDSWNADNGLPQNPVNAVLQTRDGFIWLATFAGLVRYDGADFQIFNTVTTRGIKSSRFINLFEDDDGNIWAPTEGQGLTLYTSKNRTFTTFTIENGLPDNAITAIFYDWKGNLLFDSAKGFVQWRRGSFVPYTSDVPSESDPKIVINSRSRTGTTWFSNRAGLLSKYENGKVVKTLPVNYNIVRLFEDSRGWLWMEIDAVGRQLLVWDGQNFKLYTEKDGLAQFHATSFVEDSSGVLWFASPGVGLLRFQDGKFTVINMASGLAGNDAGRVYLDREGILWVCSGGGLNRLTSRIVTSYSSRNGLAADNVYPIYQDHKGDILIGSWPGLTRYKDGVFTKVTKEYGLQNDTFVMSLAEDRDDNLWIGEWGSGVRRVKNGNVTTYSGPQSPTGVIRVSYQDRDGNMWFGSTDGLFEFKNQVFHHVAQQDGFSGQQVYTIREDREGNIWFGTDVGVTKYRDGTFTNYSEKEGLDGNFVRSIYQDTDGILWLGTYDRGLFRFKEGRFTRFTTREGLFDNGAFQILEDNQGIFWLSCNLGIYRVHRKELNDLADGKIQRVTSVPYNKRDGMFNAECNGGGQPAGIKAADGRMWFPTQQGVAVIDPTSIPVNKQPPPVAITDLIVDRQEASLSDRLEISHLETEFEIHYAALTYLRPELSRFKYKLEGLDTDWVDAGNRRFAYYTHVPFGTYTFKVMAANRDGVWSTQDASVVITVVPPFWRTWWFLSLIAICVVVLILALYKWRIRSLKREQTLRETFSRQLIESQETERKRIAAELHDSLTQNLIVIRNWALIGISALPENQLAKEKLVEISSTASQALNEVREIAYDLSPYQLDRLGLTQTIVEMINRVADASSIDFTVDVVPIDGLMSKEAGINLYRIIQESVNNIVKHSGASRGALRIKPDSQWLIVSISDNGKGFSIDESAAISNAHGFGIFGMSERVRMLGGSWHIDSRPNNGTKIDIRLPHW